MEKEEKSKFSGIPCSEESLKEYNEDFRQIEECFKFLEKQSQ